VPRPKNALELIGRGHAPPRPQPALSIHQSRQTRPASPVRSSEMLARLSGQEPTLFLDRVPDDAPNNSRGYASSHEQTPLTGI